MNYLSPERDIALPVKMWNARRGRYLTIREQLAYEVESIALEKNSPAGTLRMYKRDDIKPVRNTLEEICDVVEEMNGRIDGTYEYDDTDCELQARYRDIVDHFPYKEDAPIRWRIGAKFLRANQWLLD